MSEKFEELKKLVSFARKNGLTSLKIDGIEFDLSAAALFPESAYKQKKLLETSKDSASEPALTDEEVLFWSSEGIN